jgi:hypothetical protein
MGSRVVACGALFGMGFVNFFYLLFFCSIWDGICQIFFIYYFFFPEFVYKLSHVGLYLGWDLSDLIYLLLFFSELVCRLLLSQFFFLIILVLLNWGLMKLRPFKLLIFYG